MERISELARIYIDVREECDAGCSREEGEDHDRRTERAYKNLRDAVWTKIDNAAPEKIPLIDPGQQIETPFGAIRVFANKHLPDDIIVCGGYAFKILNNAAIKLEKWHEPIA